MGGAGGSVGGGHCRLSARLRDLRRGAGHHALRGPEATGGAGARAGRRPPYPDPGRRPVRRGHRDRGGNPLRPPPGDAESHHLPGVARGLHGAGSRLDRGAAGGPDRRARQPPGTVSARWILRRPAPAPAARGGDGEDGVSGFHEEDPLGKSHDWRLLLRLLRYLGPYRGSVAASFLLILGMAGLDLVGPYLTKIAIDRHIARGDGAGLLAVATLWLLALMAAFAVRYGQVYLLQMTGQRIVFDLRREIFAHLQRLHLAYFDRNPVGRLMTRVVSDVDAVNELFTSGVVTVFGDLFTLCGIMGVMLAMNWRLALVTFAVIPLFFVVTNWFRRGARESFRETRRWVARINAFLQESLSGMMVVQLFRREERNLTAFAEINRKH